MGGLSRGCPDAPRLGGAPAGSAVMRLRPEQRLPWRSGPAWWHRGAGGPGRGHPSAKAHRHWRSCAGDVGAGRGWPLAQQRTSEGVGGLRHAGGACEHAWKGGSGSADIDLGKYPRAHRSRRGGWPWTTTMPSAWVRRSLALGARTTRSGHGRPWSRHHLITQALLTEVIRTAAHLRPCPIFFLDGLAFCLVLFAGQVWSPSCQKIHFSSTPGGCSKLRCCTLCLWIFRCRVCLLVWI